MSYITKNPVVSIFFNRPNKLKESLSAIAKVKPERIYLVSDGPRSENEKPLIQECRNIAEELISWECKVVKIYSEVNLGCKYNVYKGISKVFESEETAIIVEDDIITTEEFFRFMDLMIDRYRGDERICQISGFNIMESIYKCKNSYVFSHFPSIWGWATWRDKWNKTDIEMNEWRNRRYKGVRNRKGIFLKTLLVMARDWDLVTYKKFNTWDFQWRYTRIANGWYGIVPSKSLIENVGFDDEATHTKDIPHFNVGEQKNYIDFNKLEDGLETEENYIDEKYDEFYQREFYEKNFYKNTIRSFLSAIKRSIHGFGTKN